MPLDQTYASGLAAPAYPSIALAAGATGPGMPSAGLALPVAPIAQAGGMSPALAPPIPAPGTFSPPSDPLQGVMDKIASGESHGDYNARYGYQDLPPGTTGPPERFGFPVLPGAPGPAGESHALRKYQWEPGTWMDAAKFWMSQNPGAKPPDINNPADEERVARLWATKSYGVDRNGRTLSQAAAAGDVDYTRLAGQWPSLGHPGGATGLQAERADIHAQEAEINKRLGSLVDQIGKLDARDPESLRQLAHYREEMEKYQQQALQLATHPPQFNPGQQMQQQGGMALIIGLLGGLLTKRPLIASMNAGAAALNAYNKGDQQEYQRNLDQWKVSTDAMFKMAEFEHQMYADTLKDEKLTEGEKLDKLKAQAELLGNQRMILATQSHDLDAVQSNSQRMENMLLKFQLDREKADKPQLFVGPDGKVLEFHPESNTVSDAPLPPNATKMGTSAQAAPNPQAVDSAAKMISDYRMAPMTGWALRGKFGQDVMNKVYELNPEYDSTRYAAKVRAEVAFTTGRQGDSVRAFSVAIDHLDFAEELGKALDTGDVLILNRAKLAAQREFGWEGPVDFEFAKNVVGDEVAKAVIGGVGSQTDRENLTRQFQAANSPEALEGVVRTAKHMMADQLRGLHRQAGVAGFGEDQFQQALSPKAKEELAAYVPSTGGGPKPSGKPPIIQNGWRYDPDTHQPLGPVAQ